MPRIPLPVRDGLNPTRLVLPHDAAVVSQWPTALAYLVARFPADRTRLLEKVAAGEIVDQVGQPIDDTTPFQPRGMLYLYRDPPDWEPEVAQLADLRIVHRDENLLVIDKPHFVAVLPRGRWVRQTALVRLRRDLDLPELSPVHRLDRLTAGILVFTVRAAARRDYQLLFERRQVAKEYEAVAELPPVAIDFPTTVRSRIVKERGIAPAQEIPGEPNSSSRIELIDVGQDRGRYRLTPKTGKTHQLRLHMASLGMPILHDPFAEFWRSGIAPTANELAQPLQLLARRLAFADPFTGREREFISRRSLSEWPPEPG